MKKTFLAKLITLTLALVIVLGLVSCGRIAVIDEELEINVSVLNGTTGFGMAKLMKDTAEGNSLLNYQFKVETDASVVTAGLINGDIDIAALPTNAASVVYNKTQGGVKVLALNTLGVLYVVENGSTVKTISDLEGKTVYCPAQNPAFVMEYVAKLADVNVTIDTTYAQPAALMQFVAASPEGTIAVLPEPVLSVAKSKNANLNTALDLTSEWSDKTTDSQLVQGCIVVRSEFLEAHAKEVDEFLEAYEASVNFVNTNPADTAALVVELEIYAGAAAVAEKAIPKCNVKFVDGAEMKTALAGFLAAMESVNPASIGGKLPADDFYYIAK
ncbi:MAG: ABC transporter substrate-binding protein [Oscillospiraceae bacterium]|nr:ABC transporter substrate-binding protein [Oscillospiraceae bacterium]